LLTLFRLARVINFIKGKMNEGKLQEGLTLKELFQVLKDKSNVKGGSEINRYAPCAMRYASFNKEDAATWVDLFLLLGSERSFFSLREDSGGRISIEKEKSSRKVLDYFFEKAWQGSILKSRSSVI
jgi:hypothetical protein